MGVFFHRATLCVSAVLAVARCLSVCHVDAPPDKKKHFLQWYQRGSVHFPRGTSLAGSQNRRGLGKFCDFRPKSPFRPTGISETVQDRPINLLLWNVNSNSTDRPVPSDRVTRITRVSRSVYLQVKYLKKNGAS